MHTDSEMENNNEDLFEEKFVKTLLSFMDDSEDGSLKSGSVSSGYVSEIFPFDTALTVVTSGYSNGTIHYGELIYKKCNFSNRLYTTWTVTAAGRTPSIRELPSISLVKDNRAWTTSNGSLQKGKAATDDAQQALIKSELIHKDGATTQVACGNAQLTVKDKHLKFVQFLRYSLLPEFQNHPGRTKISKESERSDSPRMLDLGSLNSTTTTPNFGQDKNKEKDSAKKQNRVDPISIIPSSKLQPKLKICKFCFKNGEPSVVYMGHFLKTTDGIVTCPILRRYTCDICGATGPKSHTRKYCPKNKDQQPTSGYRRLPNVVLTRALGHK